MKRLILLAVAVTLFLLPAAHVAWSKGHVALDRVQVCDAKKSQAKTIKAKDLAKRLARGDCRLPACDFNNVFPNKASCDASDANGDGFCDLANPADSAVGVTPACTNPY